MVEKVTKIQGLFADPELFGAGLHCIPRKGFLNMHVDFNAHPKGWHRRVNVLIYLNEEWRDEWNGHLQLGIGTVTRCRWRVLERFSADHWRFTCTPRNRRKAVCTRRFIRGDDATRLHWV
jgi:hypothetical protein